MSDFPGREVRGRRGGATVQPASGAEMEQRPRATRDWQILNLLIPLEGGVDHIHFAKSHKIPLCMITYTVLRFSLIIYDSTKIIS